MELQQQETTADASLARKWSVSLDDKPEDDGASSVSKQPKQQHPQCRRSRRNTHRIMLPHKTSLAYRRLEQLFFNNDDDQTNNDKDSSDKEAATTTTTTTTSHCTLATINNLRLQRLHSSPNIYIIDHFLTATELAHFQQHIRKGRFQRCYIDQVDPVEEEDASVCGSPTSLTSTSTAVFDRQHRTSTFLAFSKQHNAKIAAIEQRAADLMGTTSFRLEALQLVRYLPGQFFGVHHDLGDYDEETGTVGFPPKSFWSKRRLVTLFVYLNDVDDHHGGATYFPAANHLRVRPLAGRAVLFSNVLRTGLPDPQTIHAGEAVTHAGTVKYGVNIWLCEE